MHTQHHLYWILKMNILLYGCVCKIAQIYQDRESESKTFYMQYYFGRNTLMNEAKLSTLLYVIIITILNKTFCPIKKNNKTISIYIYI
jgi:hypothetical protein